MAAPLCDLDLKNSGTGADKKESPFKLLTEAELMVYPKGKRDPDVMPTEQYLKKRGAYLRSDYLKTASFNTEVCRKSLKEALRISDKPVVTRVHNYNPVDG